ncbi:phosphotransferase family protein [Frigidibacter oleivorans]|uniref:phosphotransferase family protein n=1 Tax=Frigidibacter oleivorans TaxID=2487129 RepID=UPI000F8CA8EC|nr:phosphotransferase [Frigidibacter oleivorans]
MRDDGRDHGRDVPGDRAAQLAGAMAHWPRLARAAGLSPEGWRAEIVTRRDEPARRRIVLSLIRDDGTGDALVLKHMTRPADPALVAAEIAAQRRAREATGGQAPLILAEDAGAGLILMEQVPGRTVEHWLDDARSPAAMRAILTRAARWLSDFHAGTSNGLRPYNPAKVCEHLARQRQAVAEGRRRVRAPDRFVALSLRVEAEAAHWQGRPALSAARHGDMNLRNILMDEDRAWGIDFAGPQTAPAGHDVARLMLAYALAYVPAGAAPAGRLLPAAEEAAFFTGYRAADAADGAIGFLMLNQLVADWARLGQAGAPPGLWRDQRMEALMRLAGRVFPDLW